MYTRNYEIPEQSNTFFRGKDNEMKILIIDDSEIIYKRLQKFISLNIDHNQDNIAIINEFENLLMDIYRQSPDIVLLNTYSLRGTLLETIRAMKTILPRLTIISLTEFFDDTFEKLLKDAGSDYFIDITSGIEKVPEILSLCKN